MNRRSLAAALYRNLTLTRPGRHVPDGFSLLRMARRIHGPGNVRDASVIIVTVLQINNGQILGQRSGG